MIVFGVPLTASDVPGVWMGEHAGVSVIYEASPGLVSIQVVIGPAEEPMQLYGEGPDSIAAIAAVRADLERQERGVASLRRITEVS